MFFVFKNRKGQPPSCNEAIFQGYRVLKSDYVRLSKLRDELVDQKRTSKEFLAILQRETFLAKGAAVEQQFKCQEMVCIIFIFKAQSSSFFVCF
jgi:hypothetical protein